MKHIIILVFGIVTSGVGVLSAVAETRPIMPLFYGHNLRRFCDADKKSAEYSMCFSFVGAVLEIATYNSIFGIKICVPRLTTVGKAVELTAKWLHEHPDDDIKAASLVTVEALADAFPCKASN
ncbi:MAG: Rap1a/Tai family immunity protein [Pseudolabrys sp.]